MVSGYTSHTILSPARGALPISEFYFLRGTNTPHSHSRRPSRFLSQTATIVDIRPQPPLSTSVLSHPPSSRFSQTISSSQFLFVLDLSLSTSKTISDSKGNIGFSLNPQTQGWFRGFFWKAARIGERLSPWVAAGCFTMGVSILFF
ncbi:protein kish-like [Senna tora]|uniref:Protein kish-like n=1 Tax=Senna tora TaxID=362788 RepID=A0A834TLD4_9FABA|nr:protein kish-like [Senna tora]